MKKLVTGIVCCVLAANVNAKASYCNFIDSFHLSDSVSNDVTVTEGQADKNLSLKIIDERSFQITSPNCTSGYAQVTIAADAEHFCVLEIHDGPYLNHPTVLPSCTNLTYHSTDHVKDHIYSIRVSF